MSVHKNLKSLFYHRYNGDDRFGGVCGQGGEHDVEEENEGDNSDN